LILGPSLIFTNGHKVSSHGTWPLWSYFNIHNHSPTRSFIGCKDCLKVYDNGQPFITGVLCIVYCLQYIFMHVKFWGLTLQLSLQGVIFCCHHHHHHFKIPGISWHQIQAFQYYAITPTTTLPEFWINLLTCKTLRTSASKCRNRIYGSKKDCIAGNESWCVAKFQYRETFLVVETGLSDTQVVVKWQHLQKRRFTCNIRE
jgi:hypothetical protein